MAKQNGAKGKRKNNGPAEQRYLMSQRWLANAAKRQRRHAARHPNDKTVPGTVPAYS